MYELENQKIVIFGYGLGAIRPCPGIFSNSEIPGPRSYWWFMGRDPAFLYYDADAAKDVAHMNRLQRGAYFDFIHAQRKFCSAYRGNTAVLPEGIPENTARLFLGNDFDSVWDALKLVLVEKNGFYFIPWLKESTDSRELYSKKQSERISKRWAKNDTVVIPRNNHGNTAVIPCVIENEIENKIEINNHDSIDEKHSSRFSPPTIEQVQEYVKEKGYADVDASKWWCFYDGKGWMIGKNKMKNWKSAVATWHSTEDNIPGNRKREVVFENQEPISIPRIKI